jgi:hypothetical protein
VPAGQPRTSLLGRDRARHGPILSADADRPQRT